MATRRLPWWWLTSVSILLGLGCLAAFWVGGNPWQGLFSFLLLAAFGAVFAVGGRSDAIRGLRGDGRDEYWRQLDWDATGLAGGLLILVVVGMCMWEWAHGRDGTPYTQLGAIAGVAYVVALVALRLRR
jgi:hypothetical protein